MSAPGAIDGVPVGPGDVLAGKYRIDGVLGRGGMGVVLAATHLQLRQRVALKVLNPGSSAEVVARFLREGRAAGRLRSEHVTRVLDVGQLPSGAPFLVMECLQGSDLAAVIAARGPIGVPEAVGFVLDACEAIAEAHASGIVHRDLKPANLFLTTAADGSKIVKVLDFGTSKEIGDAPGSAGEMELPRTTATLGSPLYMSPEQMKSTRSADARADIWSLGVILYELLTSRIPFDADTLPRLVLAVNGEPPVPPARRRPDLPAPLEAAILRCLEKDPARRFADVGELARAIAPYGPPQAEASAARASRMLAGTTSSPPASAAIPSAPPPAQGAGDPPDASPAATALGQPAWSQAPGRPRGPWAGVAIAAAAVALGAGALAAISWMQPRAPEAAAPAPRQAAAPGKEAGTAAAAAPPTADTPAPASPPAADPPSASAPSASAPSASAPAIPPRATAAPRPAATGATPRR